MKNHIFYSDLCENATLFIASYARISIFLHPSKGTGGQCLFHRQHLGDDEFAVAAPGEGAHVADPFQFDVLAGAAHQRVGHPLTGDGELELIGAQRPVGVGGGLETALYHLALVGLENDSLALEIIDVAGIDARTIHEEEMEEDKEPQGYNDNCRDDEDDFRFGGNLCHNA